MRVLIVDNYDSFTWNLVHYFLELGAEMSVRRSDGVSPAEALASTDAIVISPGPGAPESAGVSLEIVAACARNGMPLLGVCLGHQAIGQHFGARLARADRVMHGKTSALTHTGTGVFEGLPSPFQAARYHSLDLPEAGIPSCLEVAARADDSAVMAVSHRELPIQGVQFHPESIATEHGHALLANFLRLAADHRRGTRRTAA